MAFWKVHNLQNLWFWFYNAFRMKTTSRFLEIFKELGVLIKEQVKNQWFRVGFFTQLFDLQELQLRVKTGSVILITLGQGSKPVLLILRTINRGYTYAILLLVNFTFQKVRTAQHRIIPMTGWVSQIIRSMINK